MVLALTHEQVGHIARVLREVREHSLEVILANSDGEEIVRDIRKEMMELQRYAGEHCAHVDVVSPATSAEPEHS